MQDAECIILAAWIRPKVASSSTLLVLTCTSTVQPFKVGSSWVTRRCPKSQEKVNLVPFYDTIRWDNVELMMWWSGCSETGQWDAQTFVN